jgi:hypothetical protein
LHGVLAVAVLALGLVVATSRAAKVLGTPGDCTFLRGNITDDTEVPVVDLNDGVNILAYLFLGVSVPDCLDAADVNDNGVVEMSDYTYLVNFLFDGGPAPPAPFPDFGNDPTPGVSIPDDPDPRFRFSIGTGAGVPSNTGIALPLLVSNDVPITGLQMVLGYNQNNPECPDLLIQEIRTEEGTLLSAQSCEYIIAEFDNVAGVAFVAALKDFATSFSFNDGSDPFLPSGNDQLVATIVVAISSCADMGFSPISFHNGDTAASIGNVTPSDSLAPLNNLVFLGDNAVRPLLGDDGGVDVRRGFIRGDANKDDRVDIADPIFTLDYQFRGGRIPPCLDSADANNDTDIDISDVIWTLNYLFQGGPQPSEPFPQAGVDPSDDGSGSLGCESDG